MSTTILDLPDGARALHEARRVPRVWLVCTGAGRIQRGFETYARDLFERLREDGRVDVTLLKGGGASRVGERALPCIHRDAALNRALCMMLGQSKRYVIEYATFCLSMLPLLVAAPPEVVYALEAPVYRFLRVWRRRTGARFRLVHFTGGQLAPLPHDDHAFLHHVTPCSMNATGAEAFPLERQFVLPHFLDLRSVPPTPDESARDDIRRRLGIPLDRTIVLSVGNLDTGAKRMDYLVREAAAVRPTPYVIMLGQRDPDTPRVAALAESLLGPDGYRLATVPRERIWEYYAAADVFALASLREGFGLVYLEALASGLPVIAHDFDESRYVLGEEGTFADLSRPGALAQALGRVPRERDAASAARRRAYVRERFDWSVLGPEYARAFEEIALA